MAKTRTYYLCQNCGYDSPKWEGKCPSCAEWNTFQEFKEAKNTPTKKIINKNFSSKNEPITIDAVQHSETIRIKMQDQELSNVLGGGIVLGSLILLGGEPGIGKSTLTLQTAIGLNKKVLYVSGEESTEQIKLRADRMQGQKHNVYLMAETDFAKIQETIIEMQPDLVVIDSIQTTFSQEIEGATGSITQLREVTTALQRIAKEKNLPIILIGHINKEGNLAGPKILEHIVDVVLHFEGEKNNNLRILRASKNRFGNTDEIGIYQMAETGLVSVENPSSFLITPGNEMFSGCTVGIVMEGKRPILVEIQALVSHTVYSAPQRSTTGYDIRRLQMMIAILEKRAGISFAQQDVFLNIVGGIKIQDPAIDLAVLCALISSHQDIPISKKIAFSAEVGLTGEIRAVNRVELRIKEAQKLGYEQIFVSSVGQDIESFDESVQPLRRISDLNMELFVKNEYR